MDATASLICDGLIEHAIKSVLLVGLVLLALRALETRIPAAAKKFVLLGTTLIVLLLPFASRLTPRQAELRIWTVWTSGRLDAKPEAGSQFAKDPAASADAGSTDPTWAAFVDPLQVVVGVWLAGAAVFGARWIHQIASSEKQSGLLLTQDPAPMAVDPGQVSRESEALGADAIGETPPAYLMPEVKSPLVLGIRNPSVLLPTAFADWPADQQSHILRHELSHIAHRDLLWLQAASLATVVFWFNPILWVLKRRLQLEQERSCDDLVIRSDVKPSDYCETLLAVCESQVSDDRRAADDAATSGGGRLPLRIARDRSASLLNERVFAAINAGAPHRRASLPALLCIGLGLAVVGWQFSSVRLLTTWAGVTHVTLMIRVSSTSDDAEERLEDGLVDLASRDLEMPYDDGREWAQTIGIRFAGVEIPRGAHIDRASITFATTKKDRGAPDLSIAVQRAPDAPHFRARHRDISGRVSPGQEGVGWTPSYFRSADDQRTLTTTPDLSGLVQQVVDQSGWASGNALVFVVAGDASEACPAVSYDSSDGAALAPLLTVTYVDEVSVFLRPRQD